MADIGINPFTSDKRGFIGCVANATGIKYGMVVIGDTGSTDARTVKLPAGANSAGTRGVCTDHGDPNSGDDFAVGDEFSCCYDGIVEVLLDNGATATKDGAACTSGTAGTVKDDTGTGDIVGYFADKTKTNSTGAPILVSMRVARVPR
jgi:hypothetical protein